MTIGRVIGQVWATRKSSALVGDKLLLVALLGAEGEERRPTGEVVVAVDTLDAGLGQEVLVTWGSGARNALRAPPNTSVLADAAIAVILAESFAKVS